MAGACAVAFMVAHDKLECNVSCSLDTGRFCADNHAVGCNGRAGSEKLGHTLNFNNADAASTVYFKISVIAKIGNFDSVFCGDIENGFTLVADYFFAVDDDFNLFHFIASLFYNDCTEAA